MSLTEWYEKWKRDNPTVDAKVREWIEQLVQTTFDADFNDTDDDGNVAFLVPEDRPLPPEGEDLHLYDGDDNYCLCTVQRVKGRIVYAKPRWETWWIGNPVPQSECPDRDKHRYPEGPNEDIGQCRQCHAYTYEMRPEGETYGVHDDDCSLPVNHESYCVGGGAGHPPAPKIRGWFGYEFEKRYQGSEES